ncbi:hypothetical protein AAMO2058_000063900 [Amorphochlora amoebiformis]|mmetsp:Transcript_22017/g.34648  ORF Transcript_22017/g.34648 Transcript_22017/m.34648 type:complete len:160 (-) Transcript_22017:94-573(-)
MRITASLPKALFIFSVGCVAVRIVMRSPQLSSPITSRISGLRSGSLVNPKIPQTAAAFTQMRGDVPRWRSRAEGGNDWYDKTRNANQGRSEAEELARRREANRMANNGREREDLYTDAWDGDRYKGSSFNILTVLVLVSVAAPVTGVVFALATYGKLWG